MQFLLVVMGSGGYQLFADVGGVQRDLLDRLVESGIVTPLAEREDFVFCAAAAEELVDTLAEALREEEEAAGFRNEVECDLVIGLADLDFCFHGGDVLSDGCTGGSLSG